MTPSEEKAKAPAQSDRDVAYEIGTSTLAYLENHNTEAFKSQLRYAAGLIAAHVADRTAELRRELESVEANRIHWMAKCDELTLKYGQDLATFAAAESEVAELRDNLFWMSEDLRECKKVFISIALPNNAQRGIAIVEKSLIRYKHAPASPALSPAHTQTKST